MLLNDMIVSKLMPTWTDLLEEPEPVPNIALKLLSPLIDKSPVYADLADRLKIYDHVLDFFQPGSKRLNPHTMLIVKNMILSTPFNNLVQCRIVENTHNILETYISSKQDWGAEYLLQVYQALIDRADESY